jgi:hypothetical protein
VSALPQPLQPIDRSRVDRDLAERIAAALPESIRADFYREMAHCRVLPESDEMLRILRAMQFLVVLIQQAPSAVAEEREKLAAVLDKSLKSMQATHQSMVSHQRDLEQRISELPDEVSHGLAPGAIAERISGDIRQRFVDIPETVQSLSSVSKHMVQAVNDFDHTAALLTSSYKGVAEHARLAMDQMRAGIAQASAAAVNATQHLNNAYSSARLWTMAVLCVAALVTGFAGGVAFEAIMTTPAPAPQQAVAAPAEIQTPTEEPPKPKGKKKAPAESRSRMQRQFMDQ